MADSKTSLKSPKRPQNAPQAASNHESRAGMHQFKASGQTFVIDSKYVPKNTLGIGAYGVVISAEDRTMSKRKVAVKKIANVFQDLIDAKRVLREVKLLRHFNHENVIGMYDMVPPESYDNFNDLYMVMEYMETDLHKIIYSKNRLTNDHIQFFVYQMLSGLKYIHSANVLHRDLKPSNLLLNSDCELKICDFGLARGVSQQHHPGYELTEYVVTRWYRAPEIMCSCQEYDFKIDVWAVGCILAELLGREPLFPGEDYIHQMKLIFETLGTPSPEDMEFVTNENARHFIRTLKPARPKDWRRMFPDANPQAVDLMDKMLKFNPADRISVDEALAHPYLADLLEDLDNHKVECKDFDFSFERLNLSKRDPIQALMYEEIRHFRPNIPACPSVPTLDDAQAT